MAWRRIVLVASMVSLWSALGGGTAGAAIAGSGTPAGKVGEGVAPSGQPDGKAAGAGSAGGGAPEVEALARDYRGTGRARSVERDRAALFPYGHGHPVLRCAPLRACALELEAGEVVLSTSGGDSERWLVEVAATGPGGRTPLLVVKPTGCDLATNLVVATDRRLYEVGLEAPPCREADAGKSGSYNPQLPYVGVTRFYYPDELVRRWTSEEEAARRAAAERASASSSGVPLAASRLTALNFSYSWERDRRFPWAPAQVFDDGSHTYIVLPRGARTEEMPALFLIEPKGALVLLNYHVENGTFVTDRVLDHAVLTVAAGRAKSPNRLEIVNRAKRSSAAGNGR